MVRSQACGRKIAAGRLSVYPVLNYNKSTTLRQVVQQAVLQIHNKSYKWSLSFTVFLTNHQ